MRIKTKILWTLFGMPSLVALVGALAVNRQGAAGMAGDRERCLASGMDDNISKLLEKSELLALLARIAAEEVASVADHSHAGLFSASLP
jgi:hypothetical protein